MLYALDTRLTIPRDDPSPAAASPGAPSSGTDSEIMALAALGWALSDAGRANRLLDLTGLTPDALRSGLGDPSVLCAFMDFLCAHEPDLVAAADAIGVEPQVLARAGEGLGS